ncbi:hypothetical protein HK097_004224 [Rhizophlyctis rosea]|uniref:Uncharacterized protein n=1 Tax=Rhizophlyctis rosea TaxID=64517 RepID=A0AAD5S3X8_9FUNG|nr:hypothetical protein HK097_004224 [Rhizophlyctis rosea]
MAEDTTTVFDYIGAQDFIAAKKALQTYKGSTATGAILSKAVSFESSYIEFTFLKPRRFRKETLKESFAALAVDATAEKLRYDSTNDAIEVQILDAICFYADLRQKLISIYASFAEIFDSGDILKLQDLLLTEGHGVQTHATVLGKLGQALEYVAFRNFATQRYNLKEATLKLFTAQNSLEKWKMLRLKTEEQRGIVRLPLLDTAKSSSRIDIFHWLNRLILSLTIKVGLYFHQTLKTQLPNLAASAADRQCPEYLRSIHRYYELHRPSNISLIYLIREDSMYFNKGHFSVGNGSRPTGLNSFPAICSYPADPPLDHWPNLISIMQTHERMISSNTAPEQYLSRRRTSTSSIGSIRSFGAVMKKYAALGAAAISDAEKGDKGGHLVHFYDRKVDSTYFLAKVEDRVVVAVVFRGVGLGEDHPPTVDFVGRLSAELKHAEVFRSLQ